MGEKIEDNLPNLPKHGDAKAWFALARKAVDDEGGEIVEAIERMDKEEYGMSLRGKSRGKSEPFPNLHPGDHRHDRLGEWEREHDETEDEHARQNH